MHSEFGIVLEDGSKSFLNNLRLSISSEMNNFPQSNSFLLCAEGMRGDFKMGRYKRRLCLLEYFLARSHCRVCNRTGKPETADIRIVVESIILRLMDSPSTFVALIGLPCLCRDVHCCSSSGNSLLLLCHPPPPSHPHSIRLFEAHSTF